MLNSAVIECTNLTKSYGRIRALNDVSLTVRQGESFALLGENGAGKSSLVRLLMGFTFPSSGEIKLFDEPDVGRARQRIGYLPEQPQYDLRFSANEYLRFLGQLCNIPNPELGQRITDLLELVGLTKVADRRIATYSKGMTQRVGIAAALINKPALLIFDEPSAGLDPGGQFDIRNILGRLRAEGVTMLLCTHQLSEVEDLCDSVGILRRGELVRRGAVTELLSSANLVEIMTTGLNPTVLEQLRAQDVNLHAQGDRLVIPAEDSQKVLRILLDQDVQIVSLNPQRRPLEDIYLQVSRGGSNGILTRPTTVADASADADSGDASAATDGAGEVVASDSAAVSPSIEAQEGAEPLARIAVAAPLSETDNEQPTSTEAEQS